MELKQLIEKNNLKLRPQEVIEAKFDELKKEEGIFDFRPEVLFNYLSFEKAKPLLKEEYVKEVESGKNNGVRSQPLKSVPKNFWII